MQTLPLVVSGSALLIAVLSWFFRPIISNSINKTNEKNKAIRAETIAINNLKEKWLDYFRSAVSNYVNSCELLMTSRKALTLSAPQASNYPNITEYAIFIEKLKSDCSTAFALISSYKIKTSLLFSKQSDKFVIIEPLFNKLKDNADVCDTKTFAETLNKLEEESKKILQERWQIIESSLKFTLKFD